MLFLVTGHTLQTYKIRVMELLVIQTQRPKIWSMLWRCYNLHYNKYRQDSTISWIL